MDRKTEARVERMEKALSRRPRNPDQVRSVQEEGLKVCRQLGHLKGLHYTRNGRSEERCRRCGRLLGIREGCK